MATPNQRAVAIIDALVNGTSTAPQRQRMLAAYGSAETFIQEVREAALTRIRNTEAAAPVAAARQQVEVDVNAAFPEAP